MREIKFRAWDRSLKRMDYAPATYVSDTSSINDAIANWSDDVLMQFTGLLDKNKTEIYEGDIIDAPFSGWSAPVVFRTARYELDGPGYINQQNFQEHPEVYEVIGNIWENPELLDGKA